MRVEYWNNEGPYKVENVMKPALAGLLSDIRRSALETVNMGDLTVYALYVVEENYMRVFPGGLPMSEDDFLDKQDPNLIAYILRP